MEPELFGIIAGKRDAVASFRETFVVSRLSGEFAR